MMIFLKQEGFTLIEILIALAVFAILASGSLYYMSMQDDAKLVAASQDVVSTLDLAQGRTVASFQASAYGVHFETAQYVFFKGATYSSLDPNNVFYPLPSGIEIANISLAGGGSDVVFDRITGKTANYGSLQVRVVSTPSKTRTISVVRSGKSDLASVALAPAGSRLADSRHVHFTFSQDVTNASTLALDFTNPVFTQTVPFQSYLNAGKTSFSWTGTVSVGGENQTITIITHSIAPASADFSVLRDLRYNTKAVSISLDGANLINYAANGTVTQGSSANAGVPQAQ